VAPASGDCPDATGSCQFFQVTGAVCRASGYGDPAGQYFPVPGPLACEVVATVPGFVHAARTAARLGVAAAAMAERLKNSRRESPPKGGLRSRG
jgi:hypothetical protein